jgi:3-dehydroquinate dehydratase-2
MILNGPNLNLLGNRLLELYGKTTLTELQKQIGDFALSQLEDVEPSFLQTNHEGQLVDFMQKANLNYDGVIYNPAAHAYYSLALRDAVQASLIPVVEVQLDGSSSAAAGAGKDSLIAAVALAQFTGAGAQPYIEALRFLAEHIRSQVTQ